MFVDAVAGYTRKDYNFDRRAGIVLAAASVAGSTHGDTNGNEWRIGLNSGYDFVFGAFTVGPRLGVLYRETTMDDFRESGHTGLELAYDDQYIQSLTLTARHLRLLRHQHLVGRGDSADDAGVRP